MKTTFLFLSLISIMGVSCNKGSEEIEGPDRPQPKSVQLTVLNFETTFSSLHESNLSQIQFSILQKGEVVKEKPDSIKVKDADVHFFMPQRTDNYQILAIESKETEKSVQLGISIGKLLETPLLTKSWNLTFEGIGVGTAEDPFIVTGMKQFKTIAQNKKMNYLLANDLDFSSEENWVPFPSFSGVLDGGFYQLLNFRSFFPNEIKVSGLISENKGTVKNLTIRGRNTKEADMGSVWSAAFVVTNRGTVLNCANYCNMGSSLYQGGVVSGNFGTIKNCSNYGNALNEREFGGIASFCDDGGVIENCHNRGNAELRSDDQVVGFSGGIISYDVLGEGKTSLIRNCYNVGSIKPGNDIVGPIFGQVINTKVEGCFYLTGATPDTDNPNVTGKTEAALKLEATYKGWAFGNTDEAPWKMGKLGYPILYWEKE